ncbi:MAG TPA: AMP-binding protein [Burkholderiales bacterium]|nr:AMP-binding protein [Burkholderiales bacterium]
MNLVHLLLGPARRHPGLPALAVGGRAVQTYRELASRAQALGSAMAARFGLAPGDRVAIAMKNCPEYWEVLFACWHAGLAAVPMNAKLHAREFEYIVGNAGAKLCFVTRDLEAALGFHSSVVPVSSPEYEKLKNAKGSGGEPYPARPEDVAWLFYTSGTTGVPKGAMLTHRNLLFATQDYFCDIDKLGPGDAIVHAAPQTHGSGLYGLPHFAAAGVNVVPESGGFDPEELFGLLDRWPHASLFAAPTMVVRLLASPAARRPQRFGTLSYGGAPMYVADSRRAIELFGGEHLYQLFGQGESPMTITGLSQDCHVRGESLESCGVARTGVEVRVFDAGDRELPPGEVGEVVTRSDCVMAGYWENPEASAKALRGGWLHTGDVGSIDARGFLTLRDRSKDMIISGGSNIYPREIEEVLLRHPAVAECSVVGRPHAEWGEEVVAFVVSKAEVKPEELDALCLENIARFKRPKAYRFVDSLPKNNYGKVLKTELRKQL